MNTRILSHTNLTAADCSLKGREVEKSVLIAREVDDVLGLGQSFRDLLCCLNLPQLNQSIARVTERLQSYQLLCYITMVLLVLVSASRLGTRCAEMRESLVLGEPMAAHGASLCTQQQWGESD